MKKLRKLYPDVKDVYRVPDFIPVTFIILAVILIFLIALFCGGTTMNPLVSKVEKDSAAYKVGIEAGDKFLMINNHKVKTSDDISLYLAVANPKKTQTFVVLKDNNKKKTYKIKAQKIKEKGETVYRYGIGFSQKRTKGLAASITYTYKKTVSIFKQMFLTVGYLFTGKVRLSQLSGPVGIYSVVGQQRSAGFANLIYLMAFLSINVGVINLLPIPAFDGGHIPASAFRADRICHYTPSVSLTKATKLPSVQMRSCRSLGYEAIYGFGTTRITCSASISSSCAVEMPC